MPAVLEVEATMTSKGQITLPAALRARLGLTDGSKVKLTYDGKKTTLTPRLPVSAYFGFCVLGVQHGSGRRAGQRGRLGLVVRLFLCGHQSLVGDALVR